MPNAAQRPTALALLVSLATLIQALPIHAELERLLDQGTDLCIPHPRRGLSADGRDVAFALICGGLPTTSFVVRDFAARAPIPIDELLAESASAELQILGLSGNGRTAFGGLLVGEPDNLGAVPGVLTDGGAPQEILFRGAAPSDLVLASGVIRDVSFDGSVVVGTVRGSEGQPFTGAVRGTIESGLSEFLPRVSSDSVWPNNSHDALGVSEDGRVVVGSHGGRPYVWTAESGMTRLVDPDNPVDIRGSAIDVSADGSVVVGAGRVDGVFQAFRWTEKDGLTGLGSAPGLPHGGSLDAPTAISGDGNVIVGGPTYGDDFEGAYIWSSERGAESFRHRLESLGFDTSGWRYLEGITATDYEGTTMLVVGRPINIVFPSEILYARLIPQSGGVNLCRPELERDCVRVEVVSLSQRLAHDEFYEKIAESLGRPIIGPAGQIAYDAQLIDVSHRGRSYTPPPANRGGNEIIHADANGLRTYRFHNGSPLVGTTPTSRPLEFEQTRPSHNLSMDAAGRLYFEGIIDGRRGILRSTSESRWIDVLLSETPSLRSRELPSDFSGQISGPFRIDSQGVLSVYGTLESAGSEPRNGLLEVRQSEEPRFIIEDDDADSLAIPASSSLHSAPFHSVADSGRIAFSANFRGPFDDPESAGGVWVSRKRGGLLRIYRDGDTFNIGKDEWTFGPAGPNGGTFAPTMTSKGEVFFRASHLSGDWGNEEGDGIWKWSSPRRQELLIRQADLSHTLPSAESISSLAEPWVNSRGDLLLGARFQDTAQPGAYWMRTSRGKLRPLLRTGQPAPELGAGVTLTIPDVDTSSGAAGNEQVALNDRGDSLFAFGLTGPGVDESNDQALYLVDIKARPRLVLREGASIEIAHNDIRQVERFALRWPERGTRRHSPLNADREIAARLEFTDGSAAIVRLTVPRVR